MTQTPSPPAGATRHDERVDLIARARGRHLYAGRHTPDGQLAWASWRLEVAGIVREADMLAHPSRGLPPTPPAPGTLTVSEALVRADTIAFIAAAFEEVGDRAAAGFVRELEANDSVTGRVSHDDPTGPIATVIDLARHDWERR